jgi:hypothetical protein
LIGVDQFAHLFPGGSLNPVALTSVLLGLHQAFY